MFCFVRILFFNSVRSHAFWQREMEPEEGYQTRQYRAAHNAELGMRQEVGLMGYQGVKRQRGYKDLYSEANASKHGYRRHHVPVGVCRHWSESKFDAQPREAENTQEFTQYKTADNSQRYALEY